MLLNTIAAASDELFKTVNTKFLRMNNPIFPLSELVCLQQAKAVGHN